MNACPECDRAMRGPKCACGYEIKTQSTRNFYRPTRCAKCEGHGLLYRVEVKGGLEYTLAVRCHCANGDRLSHGIALADENDFTPAQICERTYENMKGKPYAQGSMRMGAE